MRPPHRFAVVAAALYCACLAAACQASITGVTGAAVIVPPPPSVVQNADESNTQIHVFVEQPDIVLTDPVDVDISMPSTINSDADFTPATIDAGVELSSTYVQFDPVGTSTLRTQSGSITFDQDIIAIIYRTGSLTPTNAQLGYPTTTYGSTGAYGADSGQDPVTLSADLRTTSFTFSAQGGEDSIRILTAVPEPSGLCMLLATPLFFFGRRARRRAQ